MIIGFAVKDFEYLPNKSKVAPIVDKRILIYIIAGILLNTLGIIVMLVLGSLYVALPFLVIGFVLTLMAVLKALKAGGKS